MASFRPTPAAAAAFVLCTGAAMAADSITITGRAEPAPASVAGFGDVPAARSPLQATSIGPQKIADANVQSIGDLTRLDPSTGDAYDAPGYWSIIAVRGYTLDNRFNYRRDGLPINAETSIPLDNKERIELLKGTSGIQAGTSAPGGLVNLVVKRPVAAQRAVSLGWEQSGTVGATVDVGDRGEVFGWRVNAALQRLDPVQRDTQGRRRLLAVAADWAFGRDATLEAEFETSHREQPSVDAFSMLGDRVPSAAGIDPRLNLNHQPWNKPVVFDGDTASLRWQQRLDDDWRLRVHAMTQRLRTDDRTAFPYGDYDPATYACTWCDRFASDGSFSYWQYVSDGERRTSDALELAASGHMRTGPVTHAIEAGALLSRYRGRFNDQVFDIAGTGRIDGSAVTPPSAGTVSPNTDRDEHALELFVRDAMRIGDATSLWTGLRRTRLHRESRLTFDAGSGLERTAYDQSAVVPWLALAVDLTPKTIVYASWGQGLESDVAPNLPVYANAGQALPTLKSRQVEAGVKHAGEALELALSAFDIDRPQAADLGACDVAASCRYAIDGSARHRGVDGSATWRLGAWTAQVGAMWLHAERRDSGQPGIDGTRPVNVPRATLRAALAWRVPGVPGLELQGGLEAESDRTVLPYDATVRIPGWSRLDLGARWVQPLDRGALTWRVGVDNAADRRAWKESPYQFGHVYLYPLPPRTWRASATLAF